MSQALTGVGEMGFRPTYGSKPSPAVRRPLWVLTRAKRLRLVKNLLCLVKEEASEVGIGGSENVGLDHREFHRFNCVRCPPACVKLESATGFMSFSSDFSGVVVVDVVSQIGPQVVDVGEGSWPCTSESGTNRLADPTTNRRR